MRNALRLVLALSGASVLGAAFLLACGDDTDVNPTTEAGTDAQGDSPSPNDAGTDAADTAPPFDGGFLVDTFGDQVATELCKSLARCCYGTPTPGDGGADGGTFDLSGCTKQFARTGFEGSIIGTEIKDAGNVVLDQVNADDCIKKIQALSCNLPGPEFAAARSACFGAYRGKIAANGPCTRAVECGLGFFCKTVDGGAGTCSPIRPLDGQCGDFTDDPFLGEQACSYRGSGDTGNFCKFYDFGGGGAFLDGGDWKCTATQGVGTSCANNVWCKDSICQSNGNTCATPDRYFDQSCTTFVSP